MSGFCFISVSVESSVLCSEGISGFPTQVSSDSLACLSEVSFTSTFFSEGKKTNRGVCVRVRWSRHIWP